ncbi:MAG: glycerophosphodiester phosphodiesterase family protein, partial [Planctomycetota bacterium]
DDVGPLEEATAAALQGYDGPVAVMSFNPHSVASLADLCPGVPRGITTSAYAAADWPLLPAATREHLARIEAVDDLGASFISHAHTDLGSERVQELKRQGLTILCWTIRSPSEAAKALRIADNITFEGYLP